MEGRGTAEDPEVLGVGRTTSDQGGAGRLMILGGAEGGVSQGGADWSLSRGGMMGLAAGGETRGSLC